MKLPEVVLREHLQGLKSGVHADYLEGISQNYSSTEGNGDSLARKILVTLEC